MYSLMSTSLYSFRVQWMLWDALERSWTQHRLNGTSLAIPYILGLMHKDFIV